MIVSSGSIAPATSAELNSAGVLHVGPVLAQHAGASGQACCAAQLPAALPDRGALRLEFLLVSPSSGSDCFAPEGLEHAHHLRGNRSGDQVVCGRDNQRKGGWRSYLLLVALASEEFRQVCRVDLCVEAKAL